MDLIKIASRSTFWSEAIYIALNVALALGVFALVRSFDQQPYLAVILIILSKWRIFAVRPRYWFAHLQSNLVDMLVGFSVVALLYQSDGGLAFQVILTGLYIAWLLFLKPRSRRQDMVWQAGVAQFVSLVALAGFSYALPSSVFVVGVWLITYASIRHVLSTYDEENIGLISLAYAFLFAQLGWFYYHWMVAYPLVGNIAVPQLAIVALLVGFVAHTIFDIYHRKDKVKFADAKGPLLFLSAILIVLFSFFTKWTISV